jgi:hypothetical protein
MKNWIYFATPKKAPLGSTLQGVMDFNFLWRSAFNSKGALIANIKKLEVGDQILLAWRHSSSVRTAYLRCRVAAAKSPVVSGLVVDELDGPAARELTCAGYPTNSAGGVEGIRLDEVEECYFPVTGSYGGDNAIHELARRDAEQLRTASTIPPGAVTKPREEIPKDVAEMQAMVCLKAAATTDAVESVNIDAMTDDRAFDAYLMIDWSSSSSPLTGKNSIWIAGGAWSGQTFKAGPPHNVSTRLRAVDQIRECVELWRYEGKRVLVGFDFAFGYPAGFAEALGLTSPAGNSWKVLHEYFSSRVVDSPENIHNRDAFADECNRKVGAPGPYWGCQASAITPSLTQQRLGVFAFPHHNLEEWRATEIAARSRTTTQSVWKLNCGVSVGGQTILGIKYLHDLGRAVGGHIWPFDGWTTPTEPSIWFAEIFPSLVQYPEWADEYAKRRDRTQVQSCVRRASETRRRRKIEGGLRKAG